MSAIRLLPWTLHEAVEYALGLFLVLAPFIFGFRDVTAFPVFVAVGVLLLAMAVMTRGPISVIDVLPLAVHAALDYLIGFFLIIAPFIFAYSDIDAAVAVSVFLGAAQLVITLVTRFPVPEPEVAAADVAGSGPPVE